MELFLSAFITFFIVIDPLGCSPIYASMTNQASAQQKRSMALRAILISALILLAFALFGEILLAALQIELSSFRIAGGIMLFLVALELVFEKRTQRREDRAQKISDTPEIEDVSVFPMAMPMIAGPGSIASIMLFTAQNSDMQSTAIILSALFLVLLLTLIALLAAGQIMKILGPQAESVITRLLGVLLAALATQFIIDGINASFGITL